MSEWEIAQLEARVRRIEAWMAKVRGTDKAPVVEVEADDGPDLSAEGDSYRARIKRSGLVLGETDE
jgi:hypothetical protein